MIQLKYDASSLSAWCGVKKKRKSIREGMRVCAAACSHYLVRRFFNGYGFGCINYVVSLDSRDSEFPKLFYIILGVKIPLGWFNEPLTKNLDQRVSLNTALAVFNYNLF